MLQDVNDDSVYVDDDDDDDDFMDQPTTVLIDFQEPSLKKGRFDNTAASSSTNELIQNKINLIDEQQRKDTESKQQDLPSSSAASGATGESNVAANQVLKVM